MIGKRICHRKSILKAGALACLIFGFAVSILSCPISTAEAQTSLVLSAAPGSFPQLAKKASPSVVNISVVKVVKRGAQAPLPFGPNDPFRDFFERFFSWSDGRESVCDPEGRPIVPTGGMKVASEEPIIRPKVGITSPRLLFTDDGSIILHIGQGLLCNPRHS